MSSLQKEIIEALKVQSAIDPEREIRRSIEFIKEYLIANPFLKTLVLGISGGQDSTLAGKLCQMAITELREQTQAADYQFIAVRLPYGLQSDESDVLDAITFINADQSYHVNIKTSVDALVAELAGQNIMVTDYNKGNIKARQRMIAQYAIALSTHGVVVGTDHAAEAVTGFYTKFGDGSADIMPIWRLNKRQGRQMLIALDCPAHLYEKVPTADLEEEKPGLPDEIALGVSYDNIDDYLEGKVIDKKAAQKIENWYLTTQHKRKMPITIYDTWWQK